MNQTQMTVTTDGVEQEIGFDDLAQWILERGGVAEATGAPTDPGGQQVKLGNGQTVRIRMAS